MRLPLGVVVLAAVVLVASACGSSHRASNPGTVSSSRLIDGGAIRCTATVATPVEVGDELGVSVSFRNVSNRTVELQPAYGGIWVLVKSPDGTAYDSRVPLENEIGPPPVDIPLRPGATATRQLIPPLHVRWRGPLRVTPGCDVSAARTVRVAVTSPGLPASPTAAVNAVVAATGGLLDHCRPRLSGVAVVGRIDPPNDRPRHLLPPLQARCSISLRQEAGFYDAQVLVVTPPDLHDVRVQQPYGTLSRAGVANGNTQAIAWEFVVTRHGATPVSSAEDETTRTGGGMAPDWLWSSSGPKPGGAGRCGGSGGGWGGDGPDVTFVSVCGR